MKALFTFIIWSLFSLFSNHQPVQEVAIPAFPGAEGFGKYTTGGRGGLVYIVTNLNDSGIGSLRWALEAKGPRIVVFEVSGTIDLKSKINIRRGNLTVAGQTAPGDGISIKNYPLIIVDTENIIFRFIRFRLGDSSGIEEDALSIRRSSNVILDQCSFSWGTDETLSIASGKKITIQNCIISEGLNYSVHSKGSHGFGSLISGDQITLYKNLWSNFTNRNPAFSDDGIVGIIDMRNCVVYNWGKRPSTNGNNCMVNMYYNYFKPGPATLSNPKNQLNDKRYFSGTGPDYGKFYMEGNRLVGMPEVERDQWAGVRLESGNKTALYLEDLKNKDLNGNLIPFDIPKYIYRENLTANEAYEQVLASAGASLFRDAVDERLIHEVRTGTITYRGSKTGLLGIIDSQNDVGGWPILKSLPAPKDTDRDGMPDEWEINNGLDPERRDDRFLDLDPYYTNLEVYLNSLVAHIIQ